MHQPSLQQLQPPQQQLQPTQQQPQPTLQQPQPTLHTIGVSPVNDISLQVKFTKI